ncbi:MAG: DEAD/DEAH box helicase, partial [Desulfomonilaceae bacterium]
MANSLQDITNLSDYIRTFGSSINEKVNTKHPPLFMPGTEWHPKLLRSLRAPFQGQGDAIMGVVETLRHQDSAFVVGEMGTGKTLIGALIPWVITDSPRVLVMCPGHLTGKWKREIEMTVPDAEVSIVRNLSDAMAIDAEAVTAGSKPRYWVLSKETGKLGFSWRPAVGKILQRKVKVKENGIERWETLEEAVCHRCGEVVRKPSKGQPVGDAPDELPVEMGEIRKRKTYCQCGEALWQVDGSKYRKMAVADYLKKNLPKNFFDFFIADEVHELKGRHTAQGNAFGTLASCSRKTICLTGTLLGGYASHLFYLNFRVNPAAMKEEGFDYRSPKKFVEQYGVEEVVLRETSGRDVLDNRTSKGRNKTARTNERPGISPELFAHQLLDKAVFLHLDDVSRTLPPLDEDVIGVRMDPDVAAAYADMEEQIKNVMSALLKKGNKQLLSTYLINLLSYPDRPFGNPDIKLEEGNLYSPRELDQGKLYPKEKELLNLVQSELSEGRRCLVYATFTQSRDVTERLHRILSDAGIKSQVLKGVKPTAREAWVKDKLADGMEVMICNPELVKTGLDLVEFPTIIFAQTGYNIFTLRQSSRRSWRIGQTQPVKVFYLYYKDTMQERAVALIGKKLSASLALEGKLTEKGLTSMSET